MPRVLNEDRVSLAPDETVGRNEPPPSPLRVLRAIGIESDPDSGTFGGDEDLVGHLGP